MQGEIRSVDYWGFGVLGFWGFGGLSQSLTEKPPDSSVSRSSRRIWTSSSMTTTSGLRVSAGMRKAHPPAFGARGKPRMRRTPGGKAPAQSALLWARVVQREIKEQHVDPGLAEEAPLRRLDEPLHERPHLVLADAAGGGDAGDLEARRLRANVRVEAARRGVHQVRRDRGVGRKLVGVAQRLCVGADVGLELRARRPEIAAARRIQPRGAGAVGGGRRPGPEVGRPLELLRQELGAHELPVALDEAAVRLLA